MFCPKCGTDNSVQTRFCRNCGFDIKSVGVVQPGESASSPEPPGAGPGVGGIPPVTLTGITLQAPEYAGFWLRLAASLIDGLLIIAVFFPLFFGIGFFGALSRRFNYVEPDFGLAMLGNAPAIILQWLYYALLESSSKQATIGKMAIGLKVTDLDGNRLSFGRATGRYFGRLLSGLILNIGFLLIAFNAKKQGLHDILAGTLVVKK
jgi:uncharacterized RDD family membrane protein YckC